MEISYPERVSRLNKHIGQGTLIRNKFTSIDAKGRATACLLAALSPEVAKSQHAQSCPADVMPAWLARLTVTIDDRGTEAAWPATIRRYATLATDWHMLSDMAWERLAINALQFAMLECRAVTPPQLWGAVNDVLKRQLFSDVIFDEDRSRLASQINKAAQLDASCAGSTGRQVLRHVLTRNTSNGHSVPPAWGCARRAYGSSLTGQRQSVDRMTNLLFDAIEKEIDVAQAPEG